MNIQLELEGELFPWRVLVSGSHPTSWHASGRPTPVQTSPWQLTFSPDLQLGISYLAVAKRFQDMVIWKHIFKMKTDKAAGKGAKENCSLSEKQAVCWHWKPTCSKPLPHPLVNSLAHTETHVCTNAQQLGCSICC